ncbi:metal transporter [Streptomyces fungicidicus]|uniref:metal transporter n=2 Tax=Streptomyces fungicidicus TaxID=68203 RepID=UPI0036C7D72A
MNTAEGPTRPPGRMFDVGLAVVLALGIVFTAFMFMTSWGGTAWLFGTAVSVVVSAVALFRARFKALTAIAGLVLTAGAVTVSRIAGDDLPQEPAPATALALSVLVGSAIRTLPAGGAAAIAVGGVAVTVAFWLEGLSGVASAATLAMTAALVLGPVLRLLDRRALATPREPQESWAHPPHS